MVKGLQDFGHRFLFRTKYYPFLEYSVIAVNSLLLPITFAHLQIPVRDEF